MADALAAARYELALAVAADGAGLGI